MLTLFADLTPTGAVCLGVSAAGVVALPALLFADATVADFDPRPLLARAGDRLLVEAVNARYTARDVAVSVTALLMLLLPAPEATR